MTPETTPAFGPTESSLFLRQSLIRGEDLEDFVEFANRLWSDLKPRGQTERYLAASFVSSAWRLARLWQAETSLLEWLAGPERSPARAFIADAANTRALQKLGSYEAQLGRRPDQALASVV